MEGIEVDLEPPDAAVVRTVNRVRYGELNAILETKN